MPTPKGFKPINVSELKDNLYYISKTGNIYSNYSNKLLKHKINKDGYFVIALATKNNKRKMYFVHQLVIRTYVGNPPRHIIDATVDHIDGNRTNNYYKNLRWMERKVNSSIRKNKGVGEKNPAAILTEEQVIEICELIIQGQNTLQQIADKYNVDKSTISNIKRKKIWSYLTKFYNFPIKKQKNRIQSIKQKEEIAELLNNNILPKDIIKRGYPSSVIYRYKQKLTNQ